MILHKKCVGGKNPLRSTSGAWLVLLPAGEALMRDDGDCKYDERGDDESSASQ